MEDGKGKEKRKQEPNGKRKKKRLTEKKGTNKLWTKTMDEKG